MNPHEQFCPNMHCPARGKIGAGSVAIHSQQEQRYECKQCGRIFSATTGTMLYGIKNSSAVAVLVITLLGQTPHD